MDGEVSESKSWLEWSVVNDLCWNSHPYQIPQLLATWKLLCVLETFKTLWVILGCAGNHFCYFLGIYKLVTRESWDRLPSSCDPWGDLAWEVVVGRLHFPHHNGLRRSVPLAVQPKLRVNLRQHLWMVVRFVFLYKHSSIGTGITLNVIHNAVFLVWQNMLWTLKTSV